jgi:hypothetical protein
MEDFLNFKKQLKERLKEKISLDAWNYVPLYILSEFDKSIRLMVEFSYKDFSQQQELKFVAEHFKSMDDYEIEINRLLNRFDSFTDSVDRMEEIAISNIGKPLSDEGSWKVMLTSVIRLSPVECKVIFTFSKMSDKEELLQFEKEFVLSQATFVDFDTYLRELDEILFKLNNVDSIPTTYYETFITQNNY